MNITALHNYLEASDKEYRAFNEEVRELQDYLESSEGVADFASYLAMGDMSAREILQQGMDEVWGLIKDWFWDKVSDKDSVDSLFENLVFRMQVAHTQTQAQKIRV